MTAQRNPTSSRATATAAIWDCFRYARVVIEFVQAVLRFPGMRDHRRGLSLLPRPEMGPHQGPMAIAPRGLHQDVATVTVARFREGALALTVPRRVLTRDEPHVGHELRRAREAPPIHDLGGEHHRRMELEAAEALQPADRGCVRRLHRQAGDLPIERVPSSDASRRPTLYSSSARYSRNTRASSLANGELGAASAPSHARCL